MIWLFIVVGAILVIVVALASVTWVSSRLARTEAVSVYDIEEAVDFAMANLPADVGADLGRDDFRSLCMWHLDYLRSRGLATFGKVDLLAEEAAIEASGVVVAEDDGVVDELLARAEHEGLDIDAITVVVVLDLSHRYLSEIGAVGDRVDEPEDPEGSGLSSD